MESIGLLQSIVLSSDVDWAFNGGPFNTGVGPREFYITPDPADPDLLHASTMFVIYPNRNIRKSLLF